MAKIRFLLVEPSATKPTPLFAFLSFNGRRIKVYSGRSIHPKQWDADEQKARTKGYPRNGALNDWLAVMTERLTKCYDAHTAAGTLPTADELRQLAVLEEAEPEQGPASEPEAVTPAPDFFTTFATWI